MLRTRVIPCLLLKDMGLVKTIQFKKPTYVGDPRNAVKIFNEKEVDELIFLDITATQEKRRPNLNLIEEIASEAFMPFGYGGGVNTLEDVKAILNLGVEKVIINSYAIEHPDFIQAVANLCGSQSTVISIDVKKNIFGKYEIYTTGGLKRSNIPLNEYIKIIEKFGAGEIMINSIDRDGTMKGYDIELIKRVTDLSTIPVIACGGASNINDFVTAIKVGRASAVSAGSMFIFHGPHRAVLISYPKYQELESKLI